MKTVLIIVTVSFVILFAAGVIALIGDRKMKDFGDRILNFIIGYSILWPLWHNVVKRILVSV